MIVSLVFIFIICITLSFFEERIGEREKIFLYILIGIALILTTGLREVGSTPDTEAYEDMYTGRYSEILEAVTEPSFTLISSLLNSFSLDVTALFLTYALIAVPLHLTVLRKLSTEFAFTILAIYISYYFMMHEMVQIRCGVASGFFLWAIYFYTEKRKLLALVCVILGTFFHYSAIAGLVIFLFRESIPRWQKIVLLAIIPIGLVVYFSNLDISYLVPDALGGGKIEHYRNLKEIGEENEQAGWGLELNPFIWLNFILYSASIYYSDYLSKQCKYVPIAIKIQAIGFCFLFFTKGFSKIIANRMNDYFSIASIILWTASIYAFSPRLTSRIISNTISTIRFVSSILAYALSLLWL